MSEILVNKRRSKGSGRFGTEQTRNKDAGKAYKTRGFKDKKEKVEPKQQVCKHNLTFLL